MSPEIKSPSLSFKKLMDLGSFILRRGFNSSKCKTKAKLATARIKLLRNRREVQVRQMRRDLAMLLQSSQDDTARIRVEHVIREQNVMAANEIIELFCELIVVRLPIIAKQRDCPEDLKEGISSLIYAAPRCSEIPELYRISEIFEKKYGKDFVAAARDLRPESGVNCLLIEKLSVRKPTGEVKMKIMKEIAKEYQIDWDATESEKELLKPPEELLEGPRSFVSASTMPVKPTISPNDVQATNTNFRHLNGREESPRQFKDTASAAQAAADSAEKAVSAAQAAAYLANLQNNSAGSRRQALNSTQSSATNNPSSVNQSNNHAVKIFSSQSFNRSNYMNDDGGMDCVDLRRNSFAINRSNYMNDDGDMDCVDLRRNSYADRVVLRRNSYADRVVHSKIKFDDSDGLDSGDNEIGTDTHPTGSSHQPPNRPPPVLPHIDQSECKSVNSSMAARVHPKLPDYEALAARFEALKSNRS